MRGGRIHAFNTWCTFKFFYIKGGGGTIRYLGGGGVFAWPYLFHKGCGKLYFTSFRIGCVISPTCHTKIFISKKIQRPPPTILMVAPNLMEAYSRITHIHTALSISVIVCFELLPISLRQLSARTGFHRFSPVSLARWCIIFMVIDYSTNTYGWGTLNSVKQGNLFGIAFSLYIRTFSETQSGKSAITESRWQVIFGLVLP